MYDYQFKLDPNFMNEEVSVIQTKAGALHLSQLTTEVGEESPALKSLTNMYEAFYNVMNRYADALLNDLKSVSDISAKFVDMDKSIGSIFTNPGLFPLNSWGASSYYMGGSVRSYYESSSVLGPMSAARPIIIPGRTG